MNRFYEIIRLSDNSYFTEYGHNYPWERDTKRSWSRDGENAYKFHSVDELEEYVAKDQLNDDGESGYDIFEENDFIIAEGFSTRKD